MKRARRRDMPTGAIDPQRAQHLALAFRHIEEEGGVAKVLVDESESPLAWLASRKGRDGRAMISPEQFIAGEKLRADFTKAQMTPRVTSSWEAPSGRGGSGNGAGEISDLILAAGQRVRHAMEACGPEFSGLLLDVCCFLRGLEDIERARGWPQRSAKIVLQLGLEKLARHYGFVREVEGRGHGIKAWVGQ